MTLGIAVLMDAGIALVADTRVSRGYHIVHDNAKKIVQLDDFTAVIHSGKNVDGWQEDLKSWHRICRERSGYDWLRYISCLQAQMESRYRAQLSEVVYLQGLGKIRILYIGEVGILTSHFVVPKVFEGIGSVEEATKLAQWLIHRVSEIQETKGMPRTVGRKTTVSIITPDGYRELQGQM